MMHFKKLREEMTDEAISIEFIMRGHCWICLKDLSEVSRMSWEKAEFILEQMVCFRVVHRDKWGRYSLTQEYRNYQSG